MDNIKIGDRLNDRWSTFYVFSHKKERYSIACDVLFLTIMADDEKRKHILQEDRYCFDTAKALSLVQRAQKKGRMQEVLERSDLYSGSLEDGATYNYVSSVIEVRETSICMRLKAVTRQGVDCTQWFSKEEFKKRFKTMENTEKQGGNSLDA